MLSLGTVFLLVGALVWMVDADLCNNTKRLVTYALFTLMFAAVTPLYFVQVNSEFKYRDWTLKPRKAVKRRHAGGGDGGVGCGNRASLRQALSEYEEAPSGGGSGQSSGGIKYRSWLTAHLVAVRFEIVGCARGLGTSRRGRR